MLERVNELDSDDVMEEFMMWKVFHEAETWAGTNADPSSPKPFLGFPNPPQG